ncbi:MAG: restriction endonuclease [Patiriisocius sp.]|uniref:restriction endonuclease n=1 Tax=Patiriisocius sp. TaxID=2822396 RepID=UPI003EF13B0D
MPIPKHDEIRIPALTILKKEKSLKLKEFVTLLASYFKLTDEEVSAMYPSGNGHIFYDRVTWALSALNMAELLERPSRGVYAVNEKGNEMLTTPTKIHNYIDKLQSKKDASKTKKDPSAPIILVEKPSKETPAEKLYASFEKIKKARKDELLNTILSKTPTEFESLVVQLLQRMGYGGEIKDSGLVTSATNDGGIDGIIKEDVLGLGRIHIQAKRYALDNGIGRDEVQKFAGALLGAPMSKGVFITTSYYSKGALAYVKNLNTAATIILIDGDQLAEYMYEYGLGMQVAETIHLKELDTDFWDTMQDN